MPNVMTIVSGKLRPTGVSKVTERYSEPVSKEMAKFKRNIEQFSRLADETKGTAKATLWQGLMDKCKKNLEDLLAGAKKIVTIVTEYADSKGAKYVETIEKDGSSFGTGTPIRKLEKYEEEYLKDGKKLITKTTHDKSDYLLMGEGHQDGIITKVEELQTKDGVTVGRRTTEQLASGYGGKTVIKEASIDGQELNRYNTKQTVSSFSQNGIKYDKSTYDPGTNYMDGIHVECNEHGIPIIKPEELKAGW